MSTSSTVSVTSMPAGESCQRTLIFIIELRRGQVLSPGFMNANMFAGFVYEHMSMEPIVVHKLDAKATLLVFPEGEEVEKICNTL